MMPGLYCKSRIKDMKTVPLALLPFVIALAGCGAGEPTPPTTRIVLVQPASAMTRDGDSYTGEIRARHEADLAFRVGGKIVARLVDNGAAIKAGQPLARLDPADLSLAADAARAQLAAAESDFATARADKERYAGLLAQQFVSQAVYDAKENLFKSAQGRLEQARSQSRLATNQASYGTLTVDYPAVVTALLADAGQVVAAGQPVLRVARPEEKEVAVAIPENRIAALKKSTQVTVTLWSSPDIRIAGELRELSAAADPATRTYAARFRLLSAPPEARLGMTARVNLGSIDDDRPLVPLTAVLDTGQGPFVRIVRDGKVLSIPVQVAQFRENGVLIGSGLKGDEPVIVNGANQLLDGQPVEARTATSPARQR